MSDSYCLRLYYPFVLVLQVKDNLNLFVFFVPFYKSLNECNYRISIYVNNSHDNMEYPQSCYYWYYNGWVYLHLLYNRKIKFINGPRSTSVCIFFHSLASFFLIKLATFWCLCLPKWCGKQSLIKLLILLLKASSSMWWTSKCLVSLHHFFSHCFTSLFNRLAYALDLSLAVFLFRDFQFLYRR